MRCTHTENDQQCMLQAGHGQPHWFDFAEKVEHPTHYGSAGDPYEVIKIIEHYDLNFCLGNTIKYILRAGRKPDEDTVTDLRKASWYLNREIERLSPSSSSPLESSK